MTGGILRIFRRVAEVITVAMMAILFLSVLHQVFTRYMLGAPVSWTMELASILWLWIIFWAGSLLVPDQEQIRVDLLYLAVPRWLQKLFAASTAAVILGAFAIAFLPTLEYVRFMRIDYSPIFRIGFDVIFSVFLLFMICAIARAGLMLVRLARGGNPEGPKL